MTTATGPLKVRLSRHPQTGQFTKCIGRYYGKDGTAKPRIWYLGFDEASAVTQALALKAEWDRLKSEGAEVWPDEAIRRIADGDKPAEATGTAMTIRQAADDYIAMMMGRAESGQITLHHAKSQRDRLNRALECLPPNRPMASIGEAMLAAAIATLCKRPKAKSRTMPGGRKVKERGQISSLWAMAQIKTLRWFLSWADESALWTKPRRFARLFKVKPMQSDAEKQRTLENIINPEAAFLSFDELKSLWNAAKGPHRLWMALALNCGFCIAELASLRTWEVKGLHSSNPHIERIRRKSGVYSKWSLWPETVDLLKTWMADGHAESLALLTRDGKPLLEDTKENRRNAVRPSWAYVMQQAKVTGTFKLLRKTGARMAKAIGGLEVSEMYLSHAEPGLNKHYAGRRWDKLAEALATMHGQLLPMLGMMAESKAAFGDTPIPSRPATPLPSLPPRGHRNHFASPIAGNSKGDCDAECGTESFEGHRR